MREREGEGERQTDKTTLTVWEIKNLGTDRILKRGLVKKKYRKYKAVEYYILCIGEKPAIASYNNLYKLFNERWEILNVCKH